MSYQRRLDNLKNKLNTLNLDGMYVTNLTNVRYLTGFTGSAGSVLILENKSHFFTDGRYIKQSSDQVKNCNITIIDSNYFDAINKQKLFLSSRIV